MKILTIKGLNINRLIDDILSNKISLEKLRRVSYDELEIQISNKEYKKLVDLKSIACYNIVVTKSTPTFLLGVMLLKRLGFFMGLIASMVLLVNSCTKIWTININVNGKAGSELEQVVREVLNNHGVVVGSKLQCSTRELEKELTALIKECSSVVVAKNGIKLEIEIKTRVLKPELITSDIVSAYNGKVTQINHSSGILTVNIGDGVSEGQVLIASGLVGDFYAEAIGEIKANVLISGSAVGTTQADIYNRSGNVTRVSYYEILGKEFYFDKNLKDISLIYDNFEVEKNEIILFTNNCLPIKKVELNVYELTASVIQRDKESLINDLKQKAYNVAFSQLPNGVVEQGVSYDIFNDNEFYKVVCNIETEVSIGIRQETKNK